MALNAMLKTLMVPFSLNMSGMSKGAFTADVDGSSVLVNGKIDMDDVSNFDVFCTADEIDTAVL